MNFDSDYPSQCLSGSLIASEYAFHDSGHIPGTHSEPMEEDLDDFGWSLEHLLVGQN